MRSRTMNQLGISLLILSMLFFQHVRAQNSPTQTQDAVSNFQPSLVVVIGILGLMFALTFILLIFAKSCQRREILLPIGDTNNQATLTRSRSRFSGIDKSVIESLPFFKFSSLKGSKEGLECAICLSKFEDIEILRLLPKCKHAFHIACIDHWLEKHSSCPICRHKVNPDDQTIFAYSKSLRMMLGEESNIDIFVHREEEEQENRHGSSRFSIGSSFRKIGKSFKEEELLIQKAKEEESDCDMKSYHKHNHKITISDVVFKHRWSNVSSSDLMFLNSEMVNATSSDRFNNLNISTTREVVENEEIIGERRSVSEIVGVSRFGNLDMKNSKVFEDSSLLENNLKEERRRQLWFPIARRTAQWFVNRERRSQQSQSKQQPLDV